MYYSIFSMFSVICAGYLLGSSLTRWMMGDQSNPVIVFFLIGLVLIGFNLMLGVSI